MIFTRQSVRYSSYNNLNHSSYLLSTYVIARCLHYLLFDSFHFSTMSACLHAPTKDNDDDDNAHADDDDEEEDDVLAVAFCARSSVSVFVSAFPIWLLSSRINNVIASLCGRHEYIVQNAGDK